MFILKPPSFLLFSFLILAGLAAGTAQDEPSGDMALAESALLEGDLDGALLHLRKAAEFKDREEALYRLSSTLADLGRFEEGLEALDQLLAEFPGGQYFHKARFLKARALEALKRYGEASELYGEEVSRLLSKERKEEVAHFYIKYAKSLSNPERDGGPQYAKAVELYRHALDLEIPGPLDEDIRLKIAELYYKMGAFGEEENVLTAFKERYPKSNALDEVAYRLAEARLKMNRLAEARQSFREFLYLHPTSPRVPEAHLGIALTYRMPEPHNDQELTLGVKALEDFLRLAPGDPKAPKAMLDIGGAYYRRGRMDEAAAAFEKLIEKYADEPGVKERAQARFTLGSVLLKQKKFADALAVFNTFLIEHPAHHLWDDAQRSIVDTEYAWCVHQMREKEYDRSREQLATFCMKHPLDGRTPDAYYALGALEAERKEFKAAISEWEKLVSKYPNTEEASQAQFRIGLIHETEFSDLEAAIEAYEKVKGPFQGQAMRRMAAMKSKFLKVITERAFTTAEGAKVKISTRNIEKLFFRAYRVDLHDYFMNQNAFDKVASLDIDLIEPDEKWESKVEDYIQYGEITHEESLPFKLPGAYLLNVSDGERDATVLVMVTNLQMILKSGREDLLVFVEDVKDGIPFEGAEVLVSDGSKVLFRGMTGKDGVFHKADEALNSAGELRVLVASGGHYASNALGLADLAVAEGLTPKAYLFTDRTVYRPGTSVRLKGFIREVDKGQYFYEEGAPYTLSLFSPAGVEIVKREIRLNAFGGMDTRFTIDASAPVGRYRFQVQSPAGWSQPLTFPVMMYTQPKAEIVIDLPGDVFHPGEKIEGTFKVQYSYGEPVKNKTLAYSYGTGVNIEKETDDKGEVPFQIDARDFAESGVYTLVASVPAEGASVTKAIYFSTTGFSLRAEPTRDVVLAGEPLTIQIYAKKADNKPCRADVELKILKLEEDERGLTTEREIDSITVDVLAKEGRGVDAVILKDGGRYRFRAAAKDRFGNLITAQCEAFVSGDADEVKLRLFTADAVLDAGVSAEVGVHMRCEENLVLLTSEGERIFEYRVERLKQGMNPVPVEIKESLAPNFTFAAAVMDGHRLHRAQVDLKVRASLIVILETETEEAAPGDKVDLRMKVTDRSGQPVEGEFAVALVDSALLARFPDATTPVHDFFFGRERFGRLKTFSSCTFSFEAGAKEIDRALLDELERRRWEEELGEDVDRVMDGHAMAETEDSYARVQFNNKNYKGPGDVAAIAGRKNGDKAELRETLKSLGYTAGTAGSKLPQSAIGVSGGAGGRFGGRRQEQMRKNFLETAYWNPSVKTDGDGKAVVTVPLPDNITTWKIMARGLDRKTSGGQGEASLRVRKKLFAFLEAPARLVEGDKAVFQGRIVNRTGHDLSAAVTLKLKRADGERERLKEVKIKSDEEAKVEFEVSADSVGVIEAELFVQGEYRTDSVVRTIEVAPFGVPVYAGKNGSAEDSATVNVALPSNRSYVTRAMEIVIGPSFSDYLLHMAAGGFFRIHPTVADTAGRLLVKLYALDYVRRSGYAMDTAPMERDIEQMLADLLLLQNPSGAFPWVTKGEESLLASGQALKSMGMAMKMGFNVPDQNRVSCTDWVKNQQRNLQGVDKIYCLHAVSFAEKPDFTELNRIYRNRNSLRNNEAAMLALAFLSAGYRDQASTLMDLLISRNVFQTPLTGVADDRKKRAGVNPWLETELGTLAHAMLCLSSLRPGNPDVKNGAKALMERLGYGQHPSYVQAAGAGALCDYLSSAAEQETHYKLDIAVNGRSIETLDVNGPEPVRTIEVPGEALMDGQNEVKFAFSGRGTYAYAVKLTGFSPDLVKPPRRLNADQPFYIRREYHQAPLKYKGKTAATHDGGWNTIQWRDGEKRWQNGLTTLNRGEIGLVEIETDSYFYHYKDQRCWHAIAVTDTLPAGTVVLEDGIKGNHSRYELGDGTITFFFNRDDVKVVYPVFGVFQGDYRAPPPVMRSLYNFDLYASADKGGSLKVNPRGSASVDTYRMKPDELYWFGIWKYEDGDYDGAKELLTDFMNRFLPRRDQLVQAATTLFKIAHHQDDDQGLIHYFELLRERLPTFTLSFMETARVAQAYRNSGEHEQALQLCSMIAGASFNRESKVAEALEKQGEFNGAVEYMKDLILTYPDLPVTQTALFALGQRVLDMAGPAGGKPRIPGESRKEIVGRGLSLVEAFLITYPLNPVGDEAAYTLISTLLDQEESGRVAALCPVFLERWPKSKLKSSMEYAEAFALFETGKYDEAKGMLTRVADREDRGLTPAERDDRDLARYILGQIEHAGGRIASALSRYLQVKDKFDDAKEASDFFNRKEVSLPEVSTFRTGEAVKLILTYCNMKDVKLSAYKVDLMKLYLARKSLKNITNINLAGIAPIVSMDISLGEGKDYKDMKRRLDLPLKEKGAYLLVVQGDESGCSGMVLVTDLKLDVQEDQASGRVRVNVKDALSNAFQKNVYMKVIGSGNEKFLSGYTDLRGIFVSDDIVGTSTVIADRDGEYAFHRGKVMLQPDRTIRLGQELKMEQKRKAPQRGARNRALQNIFMNQQEIQQKGQQIMDQIYQQADEGVQIK